MGVCVHARVTGWLAGWRHVHAQPYTNVPFITLVATLWCAGVGGGDGSSAPRVGVCRNTRLDQNRPNTRLDCYTYCTIFSTSSRRWRGGGAKDEVTIVSVTLHRLYVSPYECRISTIGLFLLIWSSHVPYTPIIDLA